MEDKNIIEKNKKVEWREVLSNKGTLLGFISAVIIFVYFTAKMFNIELPIAQDSIIEWFGMLVGILCLLGVVSNSNTPGIGK